MCYHSKAQEEIILTLMSKVLRGDRPYKKTQETTKTETEQGTLMTHNIVTVSNKISYM